MQNADLDSHRIEGYLHSGERINLPLISKFDDTLWQGGCINAVALHNQFKHIVSLYPWERYNPGSKLDSFLEVRLFDEKAMPDETQLYAIARWVNLCRKTGPVLVHCQAGLNRSGLITGLALVVDGWSPGRAIKAMRAARGSVVLCNKTFEAWLLKQGGKQ